MARKLRSAISYMLSALSQWNTEEPKPPTTRDLKKEIVILKEPVVSACDNHCVECCKRFGYVPVTEKEAQWLKKKGAAVLYEEGEWRFNIANGCRFLKGTTCSIYYEPFRPSACKRAICLYMYRKLGLKEIQIDPSA